MSNNRLLPLFIGLRYSFGKSRNGFISLVSIVSVLGMGLGVASLIVVLSVMNGFSAELRDRILGAVPHGFIQMADGTMRDWPLHRDRVLAEPGIIAATPYIQTNGLLKNEYSSRGVQITAIDPELEKSVSAVSTVMISGSYEALSKQKFGVVLGSILAQSLGVSSGDKVTLLVPRLRITPAGVSPRSKRFTVVGIYELGAQLDGRQAFISLSSGQALMAMGDDVEGLRLAVDDLYKAPEILSAIAGQAKGIYRYRDWSETQGSLFQAVKMEKRLVALLLFSVVIVAAFNIVSTLTMAVAEKRGDIAVLRTMGASKLTIALIFLLQGLFLSVLGIVLGLCLGVFVALNVTEIISSLELLLGFQVFDPNIYFISAIPSELRAEDVIITAFAGLLLSLLAAFYPAYRASRVAPAEVLRYV
ncbi:lipoprotein-releasing ABC transporter permease subunit [Halieaceae bacterium]|nr:lipoprotein-releasing ABC transporter permease subunit [Halieaceae bacterium]